MIGQERVNPGKNVDVASQRLGVSMREGKK